MRAYQVNDLMLLAERGLAVAREQLLQRPSFPEFLTL